MQKISTIDGKFSSNQCVSQISVFQGKDGNVEIIVESKIGLKKNIQLEPDDPKTQHMRVSEIMQDFGFPPMLWCEKSL